MIDNDGMVPSPFTPGVTGSSTGLGRLSDRIGLRSSDALLFSSLLAINFSASDADIPGTHSRVSGESCGSGIARDTAVDVDRGGRGGGRGDGVGADGVSERGVTSLLLSIESLDD